MNKETGTLLEVTRERENKKDLLAYQKLKEISAGQIDIKTARAMVQGKREKLEAIFA